MSSLVQKSHAHGNRELGYHTISIYFVVCDHLWIWAMFKCLNLDIIFVWDSRLCHSMHEEVLLFGILLLKGQDGQIWKISVKLCNISLATCGRLGGSIIGHSSSRFVMHVMWGIMRCNNNVGLWPLFQNITYGLSYITICEGFDKKLGVSTMQQIYLFCYFVLGLNTRTLTCFWLGQWMILVKL
jgi:hypothetical protein